MDLREMPEVKGQEDRQEEYGAKCTLNEDNEYRAVVPDQPAQCKVVTRGAEDSQEKQHQPSGAERDGSVPVEYEY